MNHAGLGDETIGGASGSGDTGGSGGGSSPNVGVSGSNLSDDSVDREAPIPALHGSSDDAESGEAEAG